MSYENTEKQSTGIILDLHFLYRQMIKNALLIFMCASLAGVGTYIFLSHFMKSTYTASANLYVLPRDTAVGKMNDYNINAAMQRSVNVLNSDTLREQIAKSEKAGKISGQLTAALVPNSNVITMSASASSAEDACRLLKAGLEGGYPALSSYFESGYLLKNLSNISKENISVTEDKSLVYSLAAAFLVLVAGFGLTGVLCIFSDRIFSTDQAGILLDMEMLGALHFIKKRKEQKAILISDKRTEELYREAVDKVVTELQRKMQQKKYKVLMVTGIKENDGKSTISANIALNLAQRGKKVVVVDCDMRRPAVARIFDWTAHKEKQLSLYLKGKKSLNDVLEKPEGSGKGITCIFQRKAVSSPDRLLAEETFGKMLDSLKKEFDYVILDTPPMGVVRDAEVIAGQAEAVLMVMRQDEDRAAVLNDVVDVLEETGIEVIGGVLNMTKGERLSGKGYYGYRKYYNNYRKA